MVDIAWWRLQEEEDDDWEDDDLEDDDDYGDDDDDDADEDDIEDEEGDWKVRGSSLPCRGPSEGCRPTAPLVFRPAGGVA